MAANLILPAGSAAADSTPADPVTRSLRFNDGDNSRLYFDPTATYDSETVYTFSCWAKLGELSNSSSQNIFSAGYYSSSSNQKFLLFRILSSRKISVRLRNNSDNNSYDSDELFRDPSAWYHLTLVRNGASLKVYVNNSEVISETISSTQMYGIGSSYPMHIGVSLKPTSSSISNYDSFDGLIADAYFIDGEAKSPTDFIESNNYGGYKPKAYTGSFGTNGFHIDAQPAHDADLLVSSIDRNDGDTLFTDAAAGHTLTAGGDPEHSIAVGNPFTGDDRAIYFDGTDDYLTVDDGTNIDLGTGDFTVEFWVNSNEDTQNRFIMGRWNATPNLGHYSNREFGITMSGYDTYGFVTYAPSGHANYGTCVTCDGKWHHIALVRSSGDAKGYVDGKYILDATYLDSANLSFSSKMLIGAGQTTYWEGAMYDFRISDTARYTSGTSDFDVPTEKFTSDSNTLLLIQPDKDDTTFHDESSSPATVTTVSAPTRTASTPYEAAAKSSAIYFDGSADCLTTSTSTDLAIASGDSFTAECWVYINSHATNTYDGIFSGYLSSTSSGWAIEIVGGYWGVYDSGGNRQTTSTAATTGEWHHVALVKTDNTSNGARLYLNGNKINDVTVSSNITSARPITLGTYSASDGYSMDGYMFDARFTKGEEKYTGSTYTVPSAPFELNPIYIGGDQSGNKNHLTPTNISGHDVMLDVPYPKNYATLNQVSDVVSSGSNTFSNGSLTLNPSNAYNKAASTIAVSSGKWYAEVRYDSAGNQMAGIGRVDCLENTTNYIGQSSSAFGYVIYRPSGNMYHNGSTTSIFSALSSGDILQIALDLDSNTVWWGLNGTWVGTVGSSGGTSITAAEYYFVQTYRNPCTWNFGQDNTFAGQFTGTPNNDEFAYEIPTGFKSLNSSNLDAPTVTPSENFDVLTYNGAYDNYSNFSGTSPQTITGTDFTPGIVWIKDRDNVSSNYGNGYHGGYWFDNVMGTGYALNTDLDNSSHYGSSLASGEDGISSFNSNGFTVDEADETNAAADSSYGGSIDTYERYVAWCWKLGTTASSWSGSGQDPDSEKYNASAGVSIIDYYDSVYDGSAITLNHSLGAAPEFAIAFDYEGYTSGHYVWHKDLSSGNYLTLDSSSSQSSDTDYFPASPATATTFTLGTSISSGTQSHVALFSGVEGYSKFGKYTGNGSSDGAFIYTGFRPAFILIKRIGSSADWVIRDTARDTANVATASLSPNSSSNEGSYTSGYELDILSNGFKPRSGGTVHNISSSEYIYAAFAESPFKHANAR